MTPERIQRVAGSGVELILKGRGAWCALLEIRCFLSMDEHRVWLVECRWYPRVVVGRLLLEEIHRKIVEESCPRFYSKPSKYAFITTSENVSNEIAEK